MMKKLLVGVLVTVALGASTVHGRGAIPRFDHVFLVVLENQSYDEIVRGGAPFIGSLARTYASAGRYFAVTHPSEGNYFALVAGDSFGVQDDRKTNFQSAPLVTDRLEAAGKSWKGYMQSMPVGHPLGDAYPYVQKHDPFIFFDGVRNDAAERAKLVPYSQLSADLASSETTPALAFIVPDVLNDMHDGSVMKGDTFVRHVVQAIMASPAYRDERSLIVIVFDEDDDRHGNQVPCIFIAKNASPGTHREWANHYALLRTIEAAFGLEPLTANDASAQPMRWMFR